jgi:hypothetical protein
MKAADVVRQLRQTIPFITNMFNDTALVTSLSYSAGTVTAVTATPHGLSITNNGVVISGALTPNPITSLTSVGLVASATTANNHDLTQGYQDTVTIQNAFYPQYNGVFKLLTVPNRRNFTYQLISTATSPDTGTPELLENKAFGYNGFFLVTVIDDFTFTYTLPYVIGSPAQGLITASFNVRITDAVNAEKAVQMYSEFQTNQYYAFIVLGDVSLSKDRHIESDAPYTFESGDDFRQQEINPFSIYVFAPSTFSLSDAVVRDTMEVVRTYLYSSLLRVKFPTYLYLDLYQNALSMCYGIGHSQFLYNGSFYVHKFDFESRSDIVYADTVGPDVNVAFRDIDLNILNQNNPPQVIASVDVDLDDVPLP